MKSHNLKTKLSFFLHYSKNMQRKAQLGQSSNQKFDMNCSNLTAIYFELLEWLYWLIFHRMKSNFPKAVSQLELKNSTNSQQSGKLIRPLKLILTYFECLEKWVPLSATRSLAHIPEIFQVGVCAGKWVYLNFQPTNMWYLCTSVGDTFTHTCNELI